MKRSLVLPVALWLCAAPLAAHEVEDEGNSLIEKGAQMLLEGLLQEAEPALNDLLGMMDELEPAFREFAQEMGPALGEILGKIGDISAYHPPEILPNGDIIIRRKTPLEETAPEEGEIDL